ncbi:2-oxo acid dehydrogenase subunit E2 [Archangium violaceum]|uniref:2-oxo acid dehydrogenase subunit E2 n=1 Tax=Archangium violaceum TaxID=83451 RepID=UPI001951E110|nr:2-oxo acid dehydrogenase subunit E2 [Archangium violaceum]QRN93165.1 2-oxo acid dehydrogenase subunit E2 [Archangium violaceum]UQK84965.1 hypothetical protein [Archangium gephyra]
MSQGNAGYELKPLSAQQKWLTAQFKRSQREVVPTTIVSRLELNHLRAASKRLLSGAGENKPVRYLTDFQFFAYWVTRALADFPQLRCTLENESYLRQYEHVHLGIAVETDAGDLVTALVEDADTLSFDAFVDTLQERIRLAMQGKDQAKQNMSVVLSYMGGQSLMFGSPLVVSPAVATLFFFTPAPRKDEKEPLAYVSMGFDHRALNGMPIARFLEGLSERLAREAAGGDAVTERRPATKVTTARELREALLGCVGQMLGVAPDQIDEHESLGVLGLDSHKALRLKAFLEELLSTSLPGTLLWHHPSVEALFRFCAGKLSLADEDVTQSPRSRDEGSSVDLDALTRSLSELPRDQLAALLDELETNNH